MIKRKISRYLRNNKSETRKPDIVFYFPKRTKFLKFHFIVSVRNLKVVYYCKFNMFDTNFDVRCLRIWRKGIRLWFLVIVIIELFYIYLQQQKKKLIFNIIKERNPNRTVTKFISIMVTWLGKPVISESICDMFHFVTNSKWLYIAGHSASLFNRVTQWWSCESHNEESSEEIGEVIYILVTVVMKSLYCVWYLWPFIT